MNTKGNVVINHLNDRDIEGNDDMDSPYNTFTVDALNLMGKIHVYIHIYIYMYICTYSYIYISVTYQQ
jgi:hypothetical protein